MCLRLSNLYVSLLERGREKEREREGGREGEREERSGEEGREREREIMAVAHCTTVFLEQYTRYIMVARSYLTAAVGCLATCYLGLCPSVLYVHVPVLLIHIYYGYYI